MAATDPARSRGEDVLAQVPRNALSGLVAFALPVAIGLLTTPYVVGRLGPEAFGLYMVSVSLVGFGGLLDFGLGSAAVRFVAEARSRGDERQLSQVINATLLSRLPLIALVVVPGVLLSPTLSRDLLGVPAGLQADATFVIRLGLCSLAISMVGGTLALLPRAAHRFDISARLNLAFSLMLTGATVLVLASGGGIRGITVCELLLSVAYLGLAAKTSRRIFPAWEPAFRVEPALLGRLLAFGGYVSLNTIAGIIFLHVNRLLVGRTLGLAAVAYFSVPWNLSSRVTQLVSSVSEAVTPAAAALGAEGQHLRDLALAGSRLAASLAGTLAVGLALAGPDFLALWMGRDFATHSGTLLSILALSAGIQALATVPYFILSGLGRARGANLPVVVAASVSLVLATALIQRYALEGLGLALLTAMSAQAILLVWVLDRALPGMARKIGGRYLAVVLAGLVSLGVSQWALHVVDPPTLVRVLVLPLFGVALLQCFLFVGGYYQPSDLAHLARGFRALGFRDMGADRP